MNGKTFFLAAAALVTSASIASALTITQTDSQPSATTELSTIFNFNNFDTSLGTLTSVQAVLTDGWTVNGTVTNTAAQAQTFTYREDVQFTITGGPAVLDSLTAGAGSDIFTPKASYTLLAPTASAAFGPYAENDTETYNSIAADLAAFEGAGGFSLNLGTSTSQSNTGAGGNVSSQLVTDAFANLQLVYTYDPTVVVPPVTTPEPGTLTLIGSSLLGLGLLRRRRA